LRKVVDYQDTAYGAAWLDRLEDLVTLDRQHSGGRHDFAFSAQAAKYLANAWCYDDIIRVADLKTRAARTSRIDDEVGASDANIVQVTEYVHPGAAEFISMMPRRIGRYIDARPWLVRRIDRWVNRGRRIRSDSLRGFFGFYLLAGMRRWRRGLYRHGSEMAHIDAWLAAATERLPHDYAHAVSIVKARRLIKGYSDTHARGLGKFDKVMQGAARLANHPDAGDWTERLIRTALADASGDALDGALKTVDSFVDADDGAAGTA
jgi:indolepyruvate ferredoxin oxidoreductase beta subunit